MTWACQEGKTPSTEGPLSSKLPCARLTRTHYKGGNPSDENFENCTLPLAQMIRAHHERVETLLMETCWIKSHHVPGWHGHVMLVSPLQDRKNSSLGDLTLARHESGNSFDERLESCTLSRALLTRACHVKGTPTNHQKRKIKPKIWKKKFYENILKLSNKIEQTLKEIGLPPNKRLPLTSLAKH